MPIISPCCPSHRACSWCAVEFVVVRRPGRPRLYCNQACRQRAYEHRHGFEHQRTVRPLPAQSRGETWSGTGYERSVTGLFDGFGRVHALRTAVRPEGRRRETLCGLLAAPLAGRHFNVLEPRVCRTCVAVAAVGDCGVERARSIAGHARRDQRASHRSIPGACLDQPERPTRRVIGATLRLVA